MNYNLSPHSSAISYAMARPYGLLGGTFSPYDPFNQQQIPFLAPLAFPNFDILKNDTIFHDPRWPLMLTKIPSKFPMFEGKLGENASTHITTYHLWNYSNSLVDDPMCFHIFQRTLTNDFSKWYIKLDKAYYIDFPSLDHTFLNLFRLPS